MVAIVGKRTSAQCRISVWHQILSAKPQLLITTTKSKKYILDYAKLPLRKVTLTILHLSGCKVIVKIQNSLNMHGN